RHPAVHAAAVLVREAAAGEPALAACVVLRAAAGLPAGGAAAEITRFLRERLPGPMVPGAVVVLPELPRPAQGKVDRQALALRLPAAAGRAGAAGAPPRDAVETALAAIWSELLGRAEVGIEDSFFALGGHSLLAVRLMARIRRRFGRALPLASLFRADSIAA